MSSANNSAEAATTADTRTLTAWNTALMRWEAIGTVIRDIAAREVAAQRHFTMQYIMEELRRRPSADRDGAEVKINNTYAPAYARLLLHDFPECRPYLELRKSRFDRFVRGGQDG